MTPSRPTPRRVLPWAVLGGCVAVLVWMGGRLLDGPSVLPPDDFVEYWAAGRLNAHGQNPYDGSLLLPLEREAGRDTSEPVMMWNPPWTLTLVTPIGLLKPRLAQLLWLAASLGLVVLCADLFWRLYGGPADRRWVAWLLALTFLPTLFVLQAGQIGPFILLGITGFLVAERAGRPGLAGAAAVLMAIKPHLVYLFWIALAAWAARRPLPDRGKVVAGGLLVGALATAIPVVCNPAVIDQYREAMVHRTPDQWKSPTLGSLLREVLGAERFDLQFVPTAVGLAWLIAWARWQRGREWVWAERLPMLLLMSFVTASYGAWPFDLVILLPAVIQVAARRIVAGDRRSIVVAAMAYLAINGAALAMNLHHCTSETFVWMAPTIAAAHVLLRPGASRP